jgi:hypothetical protein
MRLSALAAAGLLAASCSPGIEPPGASAALPAHAPDQREAGSVAVPAATAGRESPHPELPSPIPGAGAPSAAGARPSPNAQSDHAFCPPDHIIAPARIEVSQAALRLRQRVQDRSTARFIGGVAVTSQDPRFGGMSGLTIDETGLVRMVSDAGHWAQARLAFTPEGRFSGLSDVRLAILKDGSGAPLDGKDDGDGEDIAAVPAAGAGVFAVSFERRHRVAYYDFAACGVAAPGRHSGGLETPRGVWPNEGAEGLTTTPDGRLLIAGFERPRNGRVRLAVGPPFADLRLIAATVPAERGYSLTALATRARSDDAFDLYALWRKFSVFDGFSARVTRMRARVAEGAASGAGLRLGPGSGVLEIAASEGAGNLEGLGLTQAGQHVRLVLVSDNGLSATRATNVLVFELTDQ